MNVFLYNFTVLVDKYKEMHFKIILMSYIIELHGALHGPDLHRKQIRIFCNDAKFE